jgi:hypothetical protein
VRRRRLLGGVLSVLVLSISPALVAAQAAVGSVLYFQSGRSIDRLDLDGAHGVSHVIGPRATGEGVVAIAVAGPYLYWSDVDGLDRSSIWRARLDGADARALIQMPSTGPHGPVIAGGHLYWSETGSIARANLDGSHVQRDFVRLPLQDSGEAVDGLAADSQHIYFSRCQDNAIGSVALDGSEANADRFVLAGAQCPQAIAVAGGQLFWASLGLEGPGMVGQVNLNGGEESNDWLVMPATPEGGPWSLATSGAHLFYTWGGTPDFAPTFIGAASLEGSPDATSRVARVSNGGTALAVGP